MGTSLRSSETLTSAASTPPTKHHLCRKEFRGGDSIGNSKKQSFCTFLFLSRGGYVGSQPFFDLLDERQTTIDYLATYVKGVIPLFELRTIFSLSKKVSVERRRGELPFLRSARDGERENEIDVDRLSSSKRIGEALSKTPTVATDFFECVANFSFKGWFGSSDLFAFMR